MVAAAAAGSVVVVEGSAEVATAFRLVAVAIEVVSVAVLVASPPTRAYYDIFECQAYIDTLDYVCSLASWRRRRWARSCRVYG